MEPERLERTEPLSTQVMDRLACICETAGETTHKIALKRIALADAVSGIAECYARAVICTMRGEWDDALEHLADARKTENRALETDQTEYAIEAVEAAKERARPKEEWE